jgi:hypothetical protein
MRTSEVFPSKYLKATDLQGRNVLAVMNFVQVEKLGDDDRPVLYFQGKEKGLVLNRTNADAIAKLYGDEMNNWRGQEIVMFEAMVSFRKETVPAIRVRGPARNMRQTPPQQTGLQRQAPNNNGHTQRRTEAENEWTETAPPPAKAPAQSQVYAEAMDDEIPF